MIYVNSKLKLFFLLLLLSFPFPLHPHKLHHPKVIIIEINKNTIRVMMNYISNPGDASRNLRRQFDADRNGKLSVEEQDELQKYLIRNMLSTFNITINKTRPEFEPLNYKVENITEDANATSEISMDIHLLSKNIALKKTNELLISDYLYDSNIHIPTIVKFSSDFEIISTSLGKIVKKSNLVRDIELDRVKPVSIKFRKI